MYFIPAALATATHCLASNFVGLNCLYRLSYTATGVGPLFGHFGFELAHDQLISFSVRLTGPQWRNMPKRASRQR